VSLQNSICLKRAREGIQSLINANRSIITISEKPQIVNSKGDLVDDPYGVPITKVIRCRISHEMRGNFTVSNIQGAATSNLGRYILTNFIDEIKDNQTFTDRGKAWRIGKVDPLYSFGDIIGYQAPLIEAVNKAAAT